MTLSAIFFLLHSFSLHLFVSQKSVNDEERGSNCLLMPGYSYGPDPSAVQGHAEPLVRESGGEAPRSWKLCLTFFLRHAQRSNALTDFNLTHDGSKCAESRKDVPFWG